MSTITTIQSTDLITNSRADINNNFSALNTDKIETSVLDTDTTLAANSDAKVATQKAVKAYVDAGGNVNASTTAKGIVEEADQTETLAGTAVGATGARLFVNPSNLPLTRVDVFTSSGTWTKQTGTKSVEVFVIAGGGGGGGGTYDISNPWGIGGGGGQGGGLSSYTFLASVLGSTETVTVGTGGAGGAGRGGSGGSGTSGTVGGNSSFGTWLVATGGAAGTGTGGGGNGAGIGNIATGTNGAGGANSTNPGGNGTATTTFAATGGGGGGGANGGTGGTGGARSAVATLAGGAANTVGNSIVANQPIGGTGGGGGTSTGLSGTANPGGNGGTYGAGGGGGAGSGGTNTAGTGGTGGNGIVVVISYF